MMVNSFIDSEVRDCASSTTIGFITVPGEVSIARWVDGFSVSGTRWRSQNHRRRRIGRALEY